MSEPDDLYTLRNLFWLGNYQAAINEANGLTKLNQLLQGEKQEFVYRCYVALGQYTVVINEIKDTDASKPSLRVIRFLATYLLDPSKLDEIITKMNALDTKFIQEKSFYSVAAILCMHQQSMKDALRFLSNAPHGSIEAKALMVQIYLKMDRLDLAQATIKALKSIVDEDHVLLALCTAWTHLYMGPSKAQEAAYIYDELIDKYGGSSLLMNGLAVSKMHMGQFDEAENVLNEALTKASGDGETFANLIVVSTHLSRPVEVISRYISQLQAKVPNHILLQHYQSFQNAFDRVSLSYKP